MVAAGRDPRTSQFMDVVSLCPLPAMGFIWQPRAGTYAQTVIVKATFRLLPGESALAEAQEAPTEIDFMIQVLREARNGITLRALLPAGLLRWPARSASAAADIILLTYTDRSYKDGAERRWYRVGLGAQRFRPAWRR